MGKTMSTKPESFFKWSSAEFILKTLKKCFTPFLKPSSALAKH